MIEVSWNTFKSFISSRKLSIQFIEADGFYYLWGIDGVFYIQSRLEKDGNVDTIDFETNFKSNGNKKPLQSSLPFDSKELANGKKLFRRSHGVTLDIIAETETTYDFVVPYNECKINKIELLWLPESIKIDLKILDSTDCLVQTSMGVPVEYRVPNLTLNQFGFNVNCAEKYYNDESRYDADLLKNLVIRFVIKNESIISKKIGINIILHEVK